MYFLQALLPGDMGPRRGSSSRSSRPSRDDFRAVEDAEEDELALTVPKPEAAFVKLTRTA